MKVIEIHGPQTVTGRWKEIVDFLIEMWKSYELKNI